jgi:dTDP-4-dehydrorhamnose reductase
MVVLGSRGMLGQVVCRHFGKLVRELIHYPGRFSQADAGSSVRELAALAPDIVINCAGAIKQRTSNDSELLYANALLPLELAALLPSHTRLIHPSTDCVFSGASTAPYPTDHPTDARDVYGWSKYLGEQALLGRPLTLIPRVSIIGPDGREGGPGLLNWFLRQPEGSTLNGFTNHHWNGITTLEWCHQVERRLLSGEGFCNHQATRFQLGTADAINKHDLLHAFARHFGRRVTITPHNAGESVHRVLAPDAFCPPIESQLSDLAHWMSSAS